MKWQPAPIIGGAYADNARPFSHQDTVNWLPVRTERPGGRSDWKLTPAPGLKAFSTLTNASTDSSDRIRGVRNVEGRLYVVCGQSLFRINGNGTATTIQENAIPGTQRVSMTHNQETGGNTLVMTNGYGGWTYNTGTATFAEITDEGFPGFKVCDFLDQYIVGIDPTGRFAFHSELANAGSYNTLDRYEAEAAPDRLVGQVVDHGQWWLFGERTTEIYTNTGAATGTFQRIPGSTIERGLAGTFAVAKLDNSVFWVGDDGVVYRANGYTPVRISTHPIEQELSQCDLSLAFCMVYEDRGHKILYVTCPDGKTWGYDVATQEWHRRQSYARSNWRMESLVRWSGGWFGGDKLTNKLQRVDWGYQDEDGQPLIAERITGILHGNQNRVQVHGIELVLDSGRVPGPVRPPAEIVYPVEIYNPLAAAYVGVAVSHNYLGRYGVEPYTFSLDAGTLPAGLSLASTGALTGTPTTAASYAWRVKITDAIGQTDTLDQGIDLAEGIDGGSEFTVGDVAYTLASDVNFYVGPASALVSDGSVGWDAAINMVRVSPSGIYAAGSVVAQVGGADRFVLRKYDTATDSWSALASPADMPNNGPSAMAWSADGIYLAIVTTDPTQTLWVYKRSGDTFTKLADPATPPPNGPVTWALAWNADGSRLAVGNSSSANSVYVYPFSADVLGTPQVLSGSGTNGIGGAPYRFDWNGNLLAGYNGTAAFVVNTSISPMPILASAVTDVGTGVCQGVFWAADDTHMVAVDADVIYTLNFDGSSTLTLLSTDTILAAAASDSSIDATRRYLAVAENGNVEVVDLGAAALPAPTVAYNLSAASTGSVSFTSVSL